MMLTAMLLSGISSTQLPIYKDPSQSVEARVEDLLSRMTLDEKLSQIHADSKFTTAAIPRLGIPRRWMSDGPHGVREDVGPDTWNPAGHTDDFSTYMPVNICLAATWDPELANRYGTTIGQEARARGKHIMLGPGMNIMRTPLNGRNFEYFGEDPFLTSRMAVGYIEGAQAQGISSCAKHFVGNDQENQRGSINVEMDERTLREIYLPPFKAAVQEAHVWSVMGAYNRFRGQFCCHNDLILNQILKKEWGFQGLVMTDWGGAHNTTEAVLNGLDLEMGSNGPYDRYYLANPFKDGIAKGEYTIAMLDDKVRRNLRVMIATGALDDRPKGGSLNTAEHQTTARRVAEAGMVLLKNEQSLLPLDGKKLRSIAVIGDSATRKFAYGGGSAGIKAFYEVTPLEGIVRNVGDHVNVTYAQGYQVPTRRAFGGPDITGTNAAEAAKAAEETRKLLLDRAVAAAKSSDVAVLFVGLNHNRNSDTEGSDRLDLNLQNGQDELIQRVTAANRHTIVVLIAGSPVAMEKWLPKTKALLLAWYPGMEGGNAIASTLFGDVNPSGKLPCTFPKRIEDSPAHALNAYPGKDGTEKYEEGLFVGYRWFEEKKIAPEFPFGFGLSYTQFKYATKKVRKEPDGVVVDFDVTNTGMKDGAEVIQAYVAPQNPKVQRPQQELKGFSKRFVKAGETVSGRIVLPYSAFAYYDVNEKGFVQDAGTYEIRLGNSSENIFDRLSTTLAQRRVFKD